ncbi:MAG: hypothetical protein KatS3mg102_2824 [Planctomycetota bacterium]|nr:MAG: hypothetical protein KatS3mg102_2824 [Planctomycetota bacterium]
MPNLEATERLIFRADQRDPKTIFKDGFKPRFDGGIHITAGGQMTGGVSTSKDLGVAMRYAANYSAAMEEAKMKERCWVYAAWAEKGVDVIHYLTEKWGLKGKQLDNAISQMEIACEKIPGKHIIAARKARLKGNLCELYDDLVENRAAKVSEATRLLAIAFLNSGVTVSKDYEPGK